jgi:glycosyltransferase involved in cell wall biosynthesis
VSTAVLVIPCYNEAARLDADAMRALADARAGLTLLFVNDGSTDDTEMRLRSLAAERPDGIRVLSLSPNGGKAEAVRRGLLAALDTSAEWVGYLDADLSTPASEMLRLLEIAEARPVSVVMGARIARLGSRIERSVVRHYLGRIFASTASILLRLRVYDTQCGAKLFRRTPALTVALRDPFYSRWAFDVELIGRLLAGAPGVAGLAPDVFLEIPLETWRDVPGSKLRPTAMAGALKDLAIIGANLRQRRRAQRPG